MRKLFLSFLLIPSLSFAEGPLFHHKEPEKQQEFENAYKDIRARVASTSGTITSPTITTPLGIQDGTITNPGLYFINDTNTGMYRPASDSITFVVGGSTAITSSAVGEIRQPRQPSFLVTDGAGAANVTGDGTSYTLQWPTEVRDTNSSFTASTFTASVTGDYLLCASVGLTGFGAGHTRYDLNIVTSNRTYRSPMIWVAGTFSSLNQKICVIADMDAGDTAQVTVAASGSTKTVGVIAAASDNHFSGTLLN